MNWESFNWETLLWIAGFGLLFWFMMRCCGGMTGGGCGMGDRRSGRKAEQNEPKADDQLKPERRSPESR